MNGYENKSVRFVWHLFVDWWNRGVLHFLLFLLHHVFALFSHFFHEKMSTSFNKLELVMFPVPSFACFGDQLICTGMQTVTDWIKKCKHDHHLRKVTGEPERAKILLSSFRTSSNSGRSKYWPSGIIPNVSCLHTAFDFYIYDLYMLDKPYTITFNLPLFQKCYA